MSKHIIVLFFILSSTTLIAQSKEIKSIDSLLNLCIKNNCFNGDILITKNKSTFYKRTIGYRDNTKSELLKPNCLFNIASISKPFTAIAILQLQEKKLLNINDKVVKYIPNFPYTDVCLNHLLSHTSGLIANIDFLNEEDNQKTMTNDSIISLLIKYKPNLEFKPGEQWAYSNLGYDILAVIVENLSNLKFDVYMQKKVFSPAGMRRTFIPRTANVSSWLTKNLKESDIALPHNYEDLTSCNLRNIYPIICSSKQYYYGSTNVYTTVYDLEKFNKALTNSIILSKESQALAYTPYKLNNGSFAMDTLAPIKSYYGLGWEISIDTTYGKIIWHKGRSGGTRAVFLRNIDRNQMVTFLDNNDNWNTDLKAVACLKIINTQPYKNPLKKSLVQKFGCDIISMGFEKASMELKKLKETESQNYFISRDELNELVLVLDKKNKSQHALAVSYLCNELYPDDWSTLLSLGDLQLRNNLIAEAIVNYTKAVRLYSDVEDEQITLLGAIGSQFIEANRLNDAEVVLKLNTVIFPSDCNSYDNYAFILDKNNKLELAISVQEKAVALAIEQNHKLLKPLQENLEKLKIKKSTNH
jgi:CubicO group peptidase (beta-lactamase class C family)